MRSFSSSSSSLSLLSRRGLLLTRTSLGKNLATTSTTIMSFNTQQQHQQQQLVSLQSPTRRWYSPMTPAEEQQEKDRVAKLSAHAKEMELRELDKQLALLNLKRGINTGDQYTMRGKFKALTRDYGMPFLAWYYALWSVTGVMSYGAIELGGIDAIALLAQVDARMGWELSSRVDPTWGTIGLTLLVNECLEPIRLPIVVLTTKPLVDYFTKPKY